MTSKPIRERENMPIISAAAFNALDRYPTPSKQNSKKIILATCKSCNQPHNKQETDKLLATLPQLANFDYANQCLNCIKESIKASKSAKYPALRDLRHDLDEITVAHQNMHNKWKAASKEYQALDYQENIIKHEQEILAKSKKPVTRKPSTNTKTNTNLALKVLANLSPEQQEAILAMLKKQAS